MWNPLHLAGSRGANMKGPPRILYVPTLSTSSPPSCCVSLSNPLHLAGVMMGTGAMCASARRMPCLHANSTGVWNLFPFPQIEAPRLYPNRSTQVEVPKPNKHSFFCGSSECLSDKHLEPTIQRRVRRLRLEVNSSCCPV